MPIYEYRCADCGLQKEFLQKLADAPVAACPACGSESFSKLLSKAGFHLKGSGWYATDFKGASKSENPESSDASKTSDGKATAEAAPAATPCGGSCSCH